MIVLPGSPLPVMLGDPGFIGFKTGEFGTRSGVTKGIVPVVPVPGVVPVVPVVPVPGVVPVVPVPPVVPVSLTVTLIATSSKVASA